MEPFPVNIYTSRRLIAALLAVALGGLPNPGAHAYNHPEIDWRSVPTENFTIHYYDQTEPAVYPVWKIAEEAYAELSKLYDYRPRRKIDLSLAAYDDASNGFAAWTQPAIMVWLPDARFDLRANTTWLRNVITHELAHIMSLAKARGIQMIDWSIDVRYLSPFAELAYTMPIPRMAFTPMWFAEGTAQMGAQRMGADCWDSRRDMVLRCAALDGDLLTLDEMGHFTHDYVGNEMVYNQGYSLTAFLVERVGERSLARFWNRARQRRNRRIDLSEHLRENHNRTLTGCYSDWRDSVTAAAKAAMPPEPTVPKMLWARGRLNLRPRGSKAGGYRGWLTSHKDDGGRTDLVVVDSETGNVVRRIPYAHTTWDFGAKGTTVYYVKSRCPNEHGSYLNDLYAYDLRAGRERRLTHAARIYDVTTAPGGDEAACVRYERGVFSLDLISLETGAGRTLIEGTMGQPFLTADFAPHSADTLVVSRVVKGKAGLYRVIVSTGAIEPLLVTGAQEESPHWAHDGRIYFGADYGGTFDIYSIRPDGGDLRRHTHAVGGMFSPWLIAEGVALASEYTARGFRIVTCDLRSEPATPAAARLCAFDSLPRPSGKVTLRPGDYRPKLLRPIWELTSGIMLNDIEGSFPGMVAGDSLDAFFRRIASAAWCGAHLARTDALMQRTMVLGFLGAVETGYAEITTDTVAAALGALGGSALYAFPPLNHGSGRHGRGEPPEHFIGSAPARQRPRGERLLRLTANQQPTAPKDTTAPDSMVAAVPLLEGFFALEGRRHAPTLGLQTLLAVGLMHPVSQLMVLPYAQWHLARDFHLGLAADMQAVLYGPQLLGGMVTSATLDYFRTGYRNEDVAYNHRDISHAHLAVSPGIVPVAVVSDASRGVDGSGSRDTTGSFEGLVDFSFSGSHVFPLARYSSLGLLLSGSLTRYAATVADPLGSLGEPSSRFADMAATVLFTFPLVRNINRGRIYLDNLYGSLFYQSGLYAAGDPHGWAVIEALVDPAYDTGAALVRHIAGLSVQMGTIKRYTFGRLLRAQVGWDFVSETVRLKLLHSF